MAGGIQWKWVLISLGIFFVAQLILGVVFVIFGVLTFGFGFLLFLILKPAIYFVGGYITGTLSPEITIKEPAIGALIMVVLGSFFDSTRAESSFLWLIISGAVAYFCALWGARLAESHP